MVNICLLITRLKSPIWEALKHFQTLLTNTIKRPFVYFLKQILRHLVLVVPHIVDLLHKVLAHVVQAVDVEGDRVVQRTGHCGPLARPFLALPGGDKRNAKLFL